MSFLSNLFSPAQAPPTYNFKGMGTADKGVTSGIANIDRDVAATGYNPASTVQAGQQVAGAVQQLPGYANAALTQAADPQRALFDRMMHDNQQRAMATGVQQGVSNTPYQAGLVNDANNKFSQDWYNQQLQRTALGAQTAGNLLGQYETGMGQGANLQQAGGQFALNQDQAKIGDYLGYLGAGTNAENASTSAFKANNDASQAFWGGLGNVAGAAAGFFL